MTKAAEAWNGNTKAEADGETGVQNVKDPIKA